MKSGVAQAVHASHKKNVIDLIHRTQMMSGDEGQDLQRGYVFLAMNRAYQLTVD